MATAAAIDRAVHHCRHRPGGPPLGHPGTRRPRLPLRRCPAAGPGTGGELPGPVDATRRDCLTRDPLDCGPRIHLHRYSFDTRLANTPVASRVPENPSGSRCRVRGVARGRVLGTQQGSSVFGVSLSSRVIPRCEPRPFAGLGLGTPVTDRGAGMPATATTGLVTGGHLTPLPGCGMMATVPR